MGLETEVVLIAEATALSGKRDFASLAEGGKPKITYYHALRE